MVKRTKIHDTNQNSGDQRTESTTSLIHHPRRNILGVLLLGLSPRQTQYTIPRQRCASLQCMGRQATQRFVFFYPNRLWRLANDENVGGGHTYLVGAVFLAGYSECESLLPSLWHGISWGTPGFMRKSSKYPPIGDTGRLRGPPVPKPGLVISPNSKSG